IAGRVEDGPARPHVLLAELVQDDRARRRLVAEDLLPDRRLEAFDEVLRKPVRIERKRRRDRQAPQLPVTRRRVLPRPDLRAPPEGAARRGKPRRRVLVKGVEEPETRQVRKRGLSVAEDVLERLLAGVAERVRVGRWPHAEAVTDDDDGAGLQETRGPRRA